MTEVDMAASVGRIKKEEKRLNIPIWHTKNSRLFMTCAT
jgi:hypothetical protein